MFKRDQLERMLEDAGNTIKRPVSIYLIGGCAMSFRGLKDETKDIDMISLNQSDLNAISHALLSSGYHQDTDLEEFYLSAIMVFTKGDGRIDLFLREVCKRLILSDEMVKRATLHKKYGKLSVYLASNEDIFLFKSITDREKDIEDCIMLLNRALDKNIIIDEMERQKKAHWCFFVFEKLCIIEDAGVSVSFKEDVKKICFGKKQHLPSDFMRDVKDKKKHW